MNVLEQFELRTRAELKSATDEIAWWQDLVARQVVTSEHAAGYIAMEQSVAEIKRKLVSRT